MPQLASFDGVDVYVYFNDHAPPHVHAFHGDEEALVTIRDGTLLTGSLPNAKLALVRAWLTTNRPELLTRWMNFGGAP